MGTCWAGEVLLQNHPFLRPDPQTLRQWYKEYQQAPRAFIDTKPPPSTMDFGGSINLLSYLKYNPPERSQGNCGNCWAWAATGILEIALGAQTGIKDRLSVQFFNSCRTGNDACCGLEVISAFTDWYSLKGYAIPWSNTGAAYTDGNRGCNFPGLIPCADIGSSPKYAITSISPETISTTGISNSQAIANMKNVLNQHKAVLLTFWLNSVDERNAFLDFWDYSPESALFDLSASSGEPLSNGINGHAVLVVGYNDEDPNNAYWIVLNSWGATSERPNGLFRIPLNINFSSYFYDEVYGIFYSLQFTTLNVQFNVLPPEAETLSASDITAISTTLNGTVNPKNLNTTYYFEWGETALYGNTTNSQSAGSGTGNVTVSANLTGRTPNTPYHYRLVANNGAGTSYGSDFTFRTLELPETTPPSLTITSHSNGQHVTTASITLSGTASDGGYGENGIQQVTVNGSRASNDTATGNGTANWSKAVTLNTGANSITVLAYDNSENHNLTTSSLTLYYDSAQKPSVTTGPATKVTEHSATLNGTVNPSGLSTTYYFEWGQTAAYGNTSPATPASAGSGWDNVAVSTNLTVLIRNTTYHLRLVATNSMGTTYGSDMSFMASVKTLPWLELLLGD
jgi:hypothetical protein